MFFGRVSGALVGRRFEFAPLHNFYCVSISYTIDVTRVHNDYSVIGSECCNFLSTLLTFRLLKCFDRACLLNEMNYGKVMSLLKRRRNQYSLTDWEHIN